MSPAVVVLMILVCAPAGYAFAKMRFRGSEALFYLLILGLTVPIQAIVIPLYQLLSGLGLLDSLAGITLAQVGNGIPFGVFLMRNFFRNVPHELLEAARVDGCGHGRILLRIFLPISAPAVLALVVISALGTWNDFFLPLVVLISPEVQTLPLGLVRFAGDLFDRSPPGLRRHGDLLPADRSALHRHPAPLHRRPDPGRPQGMTA